jgi:GNAT superfamily N-acetyltransferase
VSAAERSKGAGGVTTTIRAYQERDEAEVVGVWYRSGRAVYTFLPDWQSLSRERAGQIFREVIRPRCRIWVGLRDERVVAFLAMAGSYIDRLYVDPAEWRNGCGTRLVRFAKTLFPDGLELCTHQQNHGARELYEKHGFRAVRFGLSPPPENVPDVEYHWRPEYDVGSISDQASRRTSHG